MPEPSPVSAAQQAPAPLPLPSLSTFDVADESTFAAALGPLFEEAPRFLARLAAARPFTSWEALFAHADELALVMPEDAQLELIDAHPRIGAPPGSVSALSFREQGYDQEQAVELAKAAALEADLLRQTLAQLNSAYEARFGFRFVVFVAGRPRSAIVPLMERALDAQRDDERRRALHDVIVIARDRAQRLGAFQHSASAAPDEVKQ
jgi:2-oxo-4-hydroxy-4-carboxy--5-ureidoimidazoline (OHCU) decarboxylase